MSDYGTYRHDSRDCVMEFVAHEAEVGDWLRCTVHNYEVLGDAYVCEGYTPPPYDPDAGRDRMKNPSINFPRSPEEAAQAVIHSVRRALLDSDGTLAKVYTTDAGLGHTRTQQQADWLTEQQTLLAALIEDLLDGIDHCTKES